MKDKLKSYRDIFKEEFKKDPKAEEQFYRELQAARIAYQIIRFRKEKGLLQDQLAKKAGTSQPAIARIEKGTYGNYSLRTLNKIAAALDLELAIDLKVKFHQQLPRDYKLLTKGYLGLVKEDLYRFEEKDINRDIKIQEAL